MTATSLIGIKETFLCRSGLPAGWHHHLTRARRGAKALRLPWPGDGALAGAVLKAIDGHLRRLGDLLGEQRLRVRLTLCAAAVPGGAASLRVEVARLNPGDLDLAPRRLALGPRLRGPDLPLAGCKRVAVAADQMALQAAQGAGFDDVLICDQFGRFSETPIANLVFGCADGSAVTPGPASGPVAGTMLARLAEADRPPWRIRPRDIAMDDLPDLRWAVMVNALRGAWPVAAIGEHPLPPPPAAWLLPLQGWAWAAKDDAKLDPDDTALRQ